MNIDLVKVFDSTANIKNPQLRGLQFQDLLQQVLIESHFEVHQNPRIAKPRQSDLHASKEGLDFLIEAKWLNRTINVSDIDALRSRLHRTPSNVIGCVFSMSAYAPTAVKAVEDDRKREILLFRPDEIEQLVRGISVGELIKLKRRAFRVDGRVWFAGEKGQRTHGSKFPFPLKQRGIYTNDGPKCSVFCRTSNIDFVFTPHTLDFSWGVGGIHLFNF